MEEGGGQLKKRATRLFYGMFVFAEEPCASGRERERESLT